MNYIPANVCPDWRGYLWVDTTLFCVVSASHFMWRLGLWGGHKKKSDSNFLTQRGKVFRGENPQRRWHQWNRFNFFFFLLHYPTDNQKTPPFPISNRSGPDLNWNLRSFIIIHTASVARQHDCSGSLPVQILSIRCGFSSSLPWGVLLFYKWALMQEKVTWIQTDGGREGGRERGLHQLYSCDIIYLWCHNCIAVTS